MPKQSLKELRQSLRLAPKVMVERMHNDGVTEEAAAAKYFLRYWGQCLRDHPGLDQLPDRAQVSAVC